MSYTKRYDGRKADELRPIEAKVGVVKNADGSAMFKIGKTIAIAAVYGPRELRPQFLQNQTRGVLRCNYNMLAFSGSGERVRPGPSRRSREISMITEKALFPLLNLEDFPGAVVDVFVELIQTDAGTRCAGITAAAMALAHAGIPMKDIVSSVAIGVIDGNVFVDVSKQEEDHEGGMADIPVAMSTSTNKITLLQADGIFTEEQLEKVLEAARKACEKIKEVQIKALKDTYQGAGEE